MFNGAVTATVHCVDTCDPVGTGEIAERLGVEHQTVRAWRIRPLKHPFPEPRWTVGGRPAWNWAEVKAWASAAGKLTSDP